jgi:hypothetical protein
MARHPNATHCRSLTQTRHTDHIAAQAGLQAAPVRQTGRLGGGLRHRGHTARHIAPQIAQHQRRCQQGRRDVIRGQDIQQVRLGQRLGGDIAGMGAAPDQIGRTHHDGDAMVAAGLRRLDRGGKLGKGCAMAGRSSHLIAGGVIMAGEGGTKSAGFGYGGCLMRGTVLGRQPTLAVDMGQKLVL